MIELELGVIVESERDRRALSWLLTEVGDHAIRTAAAGLAGARRPFVSNIIKALGLTLPPALKEQASNEIRGAALAKLQAIRAQLARTTQEPREPRGK